MSLKFCVFAARIPKFLHLSVHSQGKGVPPPLWSYMGGGQGVSLVLLEGYSPPPPARRASDCYAAGGTPLAVTQENFLVHKIINHTDNGRDLDRDRWHLGSMELYEGVHTAQRQIPTQIPIEFFILVISLGLGHCQCDWAIRVPLH